MKVLLADNDANTRRRIRIALGNQGYEVVAVADGASAMEYLSSSDGPWIALIDVMLPGMDGISICKEVRASERHHSVYVILRSKPSSPEEVVRCLAAGADDHLPKSCHKDVLKARLHLAERALRTRHALAEHAMHDPLTGLPNRTFVIERLAECVTQVREDSGYCFLLLLINIDRFQIINDSLGHSAGNMLMKHIARRLVQSVRTSRAASFDGERRGDRDGRRDIVARLDGDEFVILLESMDGMEEGIAVADRVNEILRKGFQINGQEIVVSASIGIVMSQGEATDASELLRAAHMALNRAKLQGRARYEIVVPEENNDGACQLKLETDLRHALERGELEVHYQPIMDLTTSQISRFEALLRWRHPKRGWVPPSTFIPLAEDTGLILPLGSAVLRAACKQIKEWSTRYKLATSVCVNISPRQFVQASFVQQIEDVLQENKLDAASLELEVTENLTVNDVTRAAQTLKELASCGVSVGLDDFGTGYSSLSYLLKLPIHTLKIDRSFVSRIEHSAESLSIVQTIIALGHNLGMKVTAEGIETEAQLALLKELNCDYGQGYLFSPALDSERATALLLHSRMNAPVHIEESELSFSPSEKAHGVWAEMPVAEALAISA